MESQHQARHNPPWVTQNATRSLMSSSPIPTSPPTSRGALLGSSGASAIAGWHYRRASETAQSVNLREWDREYNGLPLNLTRQLSVASADTRDTRDSCRGDAESGTTAVNHPQPIDLLKTMNLDEPWECTLDPDVHEIAGARAGSSRMVRINSFLSAVLRKNPFLPFTLRGLAAVFSVVGLALAARIFWLTHKAGMPQTASTVMAIAVLTCASVYLGYSIYDEFFGKPLGLRSTSSKMMFIMADLILILFNGANVSLAYNKLTDDHWVCLTESGSQLCSRQRGLVGLMTVALAVWVATAAVSLYRILDRKA